MNNKFITVIYTLTFASIGATLIATKFFSDSNNSLAMSMIIVSVALGIASVVTLIGELRKAESWAADREMDARFNEIWTAMREQHREFKTRMDEDHRVCHQRMDQEVDEIHNLFAGRDCAANVVSKTCKKKA